MRQLARSWLGFELGLARDVLLALRGRYAGVHGDDVPLPYARGNQGPAAVLVGVAVGEIGVVEFVVPLHTVRVVLLVLGAWTLALVVGLLSAERARPHVVGREGVLLRSGALVAVRVPRELVTGVHLRARHEHGSWTVVEGRLHLPVAGTTALDVDLAAPVDVRLPLRRHVRVTGLAIAVDDAAGAEAAFRIALAPRPGEC